VALIGLYILCIFLAFICTLWMVIRIGRTSTLRAIIVFFVPVAGLRHLIQYWGDEGNDIRTPYFAMLAFSGLSAYAAQRAIVWATHMEEAENALAKSMLAQLKADSRDSIDRSIAIAKAQSSVSFVGGDVTIPEAHATIAVPEHFRFASAKSLAPLAEALGRGVTPGTVGWIAHDKMSFTHEHPWVVVVHWYPIGHVADGPPESLAPPELIQRRSDVLNGTDMISVVGSYEWKGFVYKPEWNETRGWLAWSEATYYEAIEGEVVDAYADMPGKEGVLRFEVEFIEKPRGELAFRAVRLLANHTTFEPGWTSADYSKLWSRNSGYMLADLVSGKAWGN
jgi:uncharacterized membrane-anchored protein